ncbi:LLM class flavin-dependent oxidoreductase [Rhodococcus wratislaviensis]|uniref:FAD-binding PCMH-type domain-containing protein n=1 Tax=Rhodococcus wratislaviensis NBRC 100605 TaxID=1219028 RepID=X0PM37_RHOWR|nr:LLM class flavin-dependent oxidoreductase [Rhodococcus wratislaviensis]GAF43584.1 hypothetical protein RW1_009_00080 [Rhodococcus wratislaviensis NBRC 100605]
MPDYGHELMLGTFITPTASSAKDVVSLAMLTEEAGLDIATIQDHPYNPDFLDTYTLLSWVAARTSRLKVAANVTNLPLRPPQVLARAAATLDILSEGRFEMGLGAGAFADAAHGMTGRRPGTAQSIDALGEAIDILRGVWDTGTRGAFRHDGEHYQVPGMKRGPQPAHDISIWLGAYKPRMLALTGAKADGWLPTLEYIQSPNVAESHKWIDDAATAAGRDPRDIRRLLNIFRASFLPTGRAFLQGPPDQWVNDLLPLILEHGFSTILLGQDDPHLIRTFGEEVGPALREAVAAERNIRTSGSSGSRERSAIALSKRHDRVDYNALPPQLRPKAIEPGDALYDSVRHTYIRTGSPALVIRAEDESDVVAALAYARTQTVPLSVRSGGHGISGRSTNDGGIVLDLSQMDGVEVLDRATRRIRLQPGARWGDVARTLAAQGLAMSSGDYGDVGVGGLATAGGLGYLARRYGLTIDHVVAVDMVVADGRLLRVDNDHHPDLFWAVRGAGGNFGVVTAFELIAEEVGEVGYASLTVDATDTASLIETWGRLVEAAPRELTSFLSLFPGRRRGAPMAQITLVYADDDVEAAQQAFNEFLDVGPVLDGRAELVPYHAIVAPPHNRHHGQGLEEEHSGLLEHITPGAARVIHKMIHSGDVLVMQFRSAGGAVNEVPPEAMAYSHRTQNFSVLAASAASQRVRLASAWSELYPFVDGMYLSFETSTNPERLLDAFPEPVLSRLRALKATWDPDGIFNRNFPITTLAAELPDLEATTRAV